MKNRFLILICLIIFSCSTSPGFAQLPNLGIISQFVLFSSNGAVGNTGTSTVTGNIGTNYGEIAAFGSPTTVDGTQDIADALTAQATSDLQNVYNQVSAFINTVAYETHVFATGDTIYAGVDSISSASSMSGTLVFDAKNDSGAIFIFKIHGAFNTAADSKMVLINGASPCHIFWLADGAIGFGARNKVMGTFIANPGAVNLADGGSIEGRLLSMNGAVNITNCSAFLSKGCLATIWTGAAKTADWFNDDNWTSHVPGGFGTTLIPTTLGTGRQFPIITSGIANASILTIQNAATLIVQNSTLKINGHFINKGSLDATQGTIDYRDLTSDSLKANVLGKTVQNLIFNQSIRLTGQQDITGKLSFGDNNITLNTAGYLTLKSGSTGTAQLADITNGGTNTGNSITGNIILERFIPAKRAWVLLSAPVTPGTAPSINAAWQEGATSSALVPNPNPGYGTQITGGTDLNGYDQGINGNSSIKFYNSATNSYSRLPAATGTYTPISSYPGYMLFIRGDRGTNLLQGVNAALSNTTLRMQGAVNTGSVSIPVNAKNLTLVGNPYASPIDFHTLIKTNVRDQVYFWDPWLAGTGYGGYVALSWNSGTNSYDATSASSPVNQYVASGAAFFVLTIDSTKTGSLIINETDKNSGGSDNVFRPMGNEVPKLRVDLFGIKTNNPIPYLADGVLTTYADNNNNGVDINDAPKLLSDVENISINRNDKLLAIERRQTITNNDTAFLKLSYLKKQQYHLTITAANMNNSGLYGLIKDNYAAINNNTLVNLNGAMELPFLVDSSAASYAADRFSIVFGKLASIPFTNIILKAFAQQKNIEVNFNTIYEKDVSNYSIETSATGTDFYSTAIITSKANAGMAEAYSITDSNVISGDHYYRIKSTGITGKLSYSNIVKVIIDEAHSASNIKATPGIIQDNNLQFQLNNLPAGAYTAQVFSINGQLIAAIAVDHNGSNGSVYTLSFKNYLAAEKYQLILSNKSTHLSTSFLKQ